MRAGSLGRGARTGLRRASAGCHFARDRKRGRARDRRAAVTRPRQNPCFHKGLISPGGGRFGACGRGLGLATIAVSGPTAAVCATASERRKRLLTKGARLRDGEAMRSKTRTRRDARSHMRGSSARDSRWRTVFAALILLGLPAGPVLLSNGRAPEGAPPVRDESHTIQTASVTAGAQTGSGTTKDEVDSAGTKDGRYTPGRRTM